MHILFIRDCLLKTQPVEDPERAMVALGGALQGMGHVVTYLVQPGSEPINGMATLPLHADKPLEEQIPDGVDLVHFHCTPPDQAISLPNLSTLYDHLPPGASTSPNTVFVSADQARRHGSSVFVHPGLNWDAYGPLLLGHSRPYCHFIGDATWPEQNVRSAIDIAGKAGVRLHVIGGTRFSFRREWRFTLSPNVRFHGDLHPEGRYALMNQSRALLHPVRWPEPFSLAAIESLYFGCPVIGTPTGGLYELIHPSFSLRQTEGNWNGRVDAIYSDWGCLSFRTSELIEAVRNVRAFDSHDCHEYARERFSSVQTASAYLVLYERVLQGEWLHDKAPVGIHDDKWGVLAQMEA